MCVGGTDGPTDPKSPVDQDACLSVTFLGATVGIIIAFGIALLGSLAAACVK